MAEVFISYSRRDHDRVQELVDRLHDAGADVWLDLDDITPSTTWTRKIAQGIKECKVFLLVASKESFASNPVRKEVSLAAKKSKVILPVYLEPAEIPDTLDYHLIDIQHVELFGDGLQYAYREILNTLHDAGVSCDVPEIEEAEEGAEKPAGVRTHRPPRPHPRPPRVQPRPEESAPGTPPRRKTAHYAVGVGLVIAAGVLIRQVWPGDDGPSFEEPSLLVGIPTEHSGLLANGSLELVELDLEGEEHPLLSVPTEEDWAQNEGPEVEIAEVIDATWRRLENVPSDAPIPANATLEVRFRVDDVVVARKRFAIEAEAFADAQVVVLDGALDEPAILIGVPVGRFSVLDGSWVELAEIAESCEHSEENWESDEIHKNGCERLIATVHTQDKRASVLIGRDVGDMDRSYIKTWSEGSDLNSRTDSFVQGVEEAWTRFLGPPLTLEHPIRARARLDARFRTARGTLVARKGFVLQELAYESVQAVLLNGI